MRAEVRTGVHCRLDDLLAERGMTLTALAEQADITLANLSVLKNDRARAVRFSTLVAVCEALQCEIGELLVLDRTTHGGQTAGGVSRDAAARAESSS